MYSTDIWQKLSNGGWRWIDTEVHGFFGCDERQVGFVDAEGGGGGGASKGGATEPAIVVTATRRRRALTICEANYAGASISNLGLSFDLRSFSFVEGLDSTANYFSRRAINQDGIWAVTQQDTVFVNPDSWSAVTDPSGSTFWEEIFHSAQFSTLGPRRFYMAYGLGSVEAALHARPTYDNFIERQAKDWAQRISQRYRRERPCAG